MIKTIRVKLVLVFSFFIMALILIGILMNTFFLEDFYVLKNKAVFIEVSNEISAELKQSPAGVQDFIDRIDRLEGISVMITEGDQWIKYVSYPLKQGNGEDRIPKELETVIQGNSGDEIYTTIERDKSETPKLSYIRKHGDGYIILTKPLKGVRESAAIANQFYILGGAVIFLIGLPAAYFISRSITVPIVGMSKTAEKISNLDFGDRIEIKSVDELGTLGRSINEISVKLSLSMERLTSDIERRKQMVRDLSHELKTPVGVIKGYAEGLKFAVAGDAEKMDQYCSVISDECDRMDQMVKQLLELSMLEDPAMFLSYVKFPVSSIAQSLNKRFEPMMLQNGMQFDLRAVDDFEINADPVLLERAVSNLLTNAINYNNSRKMIRLTIEKNETEVIFIVFNTSEGIPDDVKEKIFDVFYKVDQARSRDSGGNGVGLAIVKSIAELHHGSVEAENKEGGVEIILKMPVDFTSIS